jgi:polysaccharide biosynthesis protein PslH
MSQILFLSRWYPYPPSNGSKLRIFNLLRGLAEAGHSVRLLSFVEPDARAVDVDGLRPYCQAVQTTPWRQFAPESRRARLGLLSATPRSVLDTWSPEMSQMIEDELATRRPDLIIASQIDTASYVPANSGVPALFEEVELGLMVEQYTAAAGAAQRLRYGLTWAKHRRYLRSLLDRFAACTVVSLREQQLLAAAAPGFPSAEIIPNCIHLPDYQPINPPTHQSTNLPIYQPTNPPTHQSTNLPIYQPTNPPTHQLIFTGAFTYHVNYEGAIWFVSEVFPRVRAQVGDVTLTITGNHANLPFPAAAGVTLTGFVDDVRPLIASSAVCVAPIWQGGGTRLKILEAMALGAPVVATSKGAEGLDAQDGMHLLIADEPAAFAEAVVRLLRDPQLRQHLIEQALALIEQHYSCEMVMPRFLQLVHRLVSRTELR